MAGLDWFELDVDMPDDPKVVGLAARLKNPCAGWYVVRLYAYCYKHAQDRFTGPGAPAAIEDTAARWKGRAGALLAALIEEGFVDHGEGETLIVHGVEARLAPHLAKREADKDRQKRKRDTAAKSLKRRADVAATSRGCRADVPTYNDNDNDNDQDVNDQRDGSVGDSSGPKPAPTPFERLRIEVSQALLRMDNGGRGIAPPAGRNLGEQIRNAVAAIEKHGFDVVRDACVTHARASDAKPETMTFFARTIAGLAEGDWPKRKRQPGENPAITDADYDNPDAWWSLAAFKARPRRNAA